MVCGPRTADWSTTKPEFMGLRPRTCRYARNKKCSNYGSAEALKIYVYIPNQLLNSCVTG